MPEGLEPSPEEMGIQGDNQQSSAESIDSEKITVPEPVLDESTREEIGAELAKGLEAKFPSVIKPSSFNNLVRRWDPNVLLEYFRQAEKAGTTYVVDRWSSKNATRLLSSEIALSDVKLVNTTRSGSTTYAAGMLCSTDKGVGKIIGYHNVLDDGYRPDKSLKTPRLPVFTIEYPDGSREEMNSFPKLLHSADPGFSPKIFTGEVPEAFAQYVSLETEQGTWTIGETFYFLEDPTSGGQVVFIPNQLEHPGDIGITFLDKSNRSQTGIVSVDKIAKR
jgi:hypothetical protein